MNLNKFFLNVIVTSMFLYFNQTFSMQNQQQSSSWENTKSTVNNACKNIKNTFFETEEENYAKEIEQNKPALDAIERIKECIKNNTDIDPEDILLVELNEKVYKENILLIERAKEIRLEKNKNFIEENKNTLIQQNQFKCSSCWFFPYEGTPKYNCPICLLTCFCNKKCYDENKEKHKKACPQKIIELNAKKAQECINRLKICIDTDVDPYPEDVLFAWYNTSQNSPSWNIVIQAIDLRFKKNNKMYNNNKILNPHCCFCDGYICLQCDKAHPKNLPCENYKNNESFKYCRLCLKALFCDNKCGNKGNNEHLKHDCKEFTKNEKIEKEYLNKCIDRLKICIDTDVDPDPEDIRFAWNNTSQNSPSWNIVIKAIDLRFKKNNKMYNNNKTLNPHCCFCNGYICLKCNKAHPENLPCENYKNNESFKYCRLCLKALYCNNKCVDKGYNEHLKHDCKEFTKNEKIEKEFFKNLEQGQNNLDENIPANIDEKEKKIYEELKKIFIENSNESICKNKIDYFWLKSIDHSDNKINGCVSKKYFEQNQHFRIDDLRNKNERILGFKPEETSGTQAIRNAKIINEIFSLTEQEKNKNNINIESIIKKLNDQLDATKFLGGTISENRTTSFLEAKDIEGRIGEDELSEDITVLDSILEIEKTKSEKINEIINNFREKNNYSHIFIINTADVHHHNTISKKNNRKSILNALDIVSINYQRKLHQKVSDTSLTELKNKQRDVNEWYVLALIKRGHHKACLIIDTEKETVKILKKQPNNIAFSEYIFNPSVNFINAIKNKVQDEATLVFNNSLNNGELLPEDETIYDPRMLITNEESNISKDTENSIYKHAPRSVKKIIKDLIKLKEQRELLNNPNFGKDKDKVFIIGGPCGTGKSETARVIAKKTNRKIRFIRCGLLGTKYQYSESENLKNEIYPIIDECKLGASYLIVLDEVDAISTNSNGEKKDNDRLNTAISAIFDICNNYDIIFICTTNNPDQLDQRFKSRATGNAVMLGLPTETIRKGLIKNFLLEKSKKSKREEFIDLDYDSVDIDYLAKKTNNFSARAIKKLINAAYDNAHDKIWYSTLDRKNIKSITIKNDDFIDALKTIKNDLEKTPIFSKSLWAKIFDNLIVPVGSMALNTTINVITANVLNRATASFDYYIESNKIKSEIKEANKKHFLNPSKHTDLYLLNKKQEALEEQYKIKTSGYNLNVSGFYQDAYGITKEALSLASLIMNCAPGAPKIGTVNNFNFPTEPKQ